MSTGNNKMLAKTPLGDAVDLYDKLAPRYDKLHHRWLHHAGGEALAAMEGLVRALATPNSKFWMLAAAPVIWHVH